MTFQRRQFLKWAALLGFEPTANMPAEFAQRMRAEFEMWTKVIKDSNIKA